MNRNYKKGAGGKLQPYISKGNGEKSGQYTKNDSSGGYLAAESCTEIDLEKILSKKELFSVKSYTNYKIGTALNAAIREGRMTEADKELKDQILSAIAKHKLKQPIAVFRGIVVSREVFERNFLVPYLLDIPIDGSLICSTTRRLERAAIGAKAKKQGDIGIIFYGVLPANCPALPLEGISENPEEKEILVTAPKYQIEEITNCSCKGFKFKRIKIKII